MANIAPDLIVFNNAKLKFGTDNYELSVNKAELKPTTPKKKFKGIGGNTISKVGTPDWTLTLGFAQDWVTVKALSKILLETAPGTQVVVDIFPISGGPGYRVTIAVEPGTIGGDVEAELLDTVAFDVSGQPALIAA